LLLDCLEEVIILFVILWNVLLLFLLLRETAINTSDSELLVCEPLIKRYIAPINALSSVQHKEGKV